MTTEKTSWLNLRHTIFGEVVKGMEIVLKIEKSPVGPGDRPVKEQKILKAFLK
ncbi:MAG: peptidylprolyl isomerase [Parachlamydiales bacterium]